MSGATQGQFTLLDKYFFYKRTFLCVYFVLKGESYKTRRSRLARFLL